MNLTFKTAIANGLAQTGLLGFGERMLGTGSIILTLHRVLPTAEMNDCYNAYLAITPASLTSLLSFLRTRYKIVSLKSLLQTIQTSEPGPFCAITVDDGWEDNYRHAFPILKQASIPATIFLCTGLVGTSSTIPEERFWRLRRNAEASGQMSSFSKSLNDLLPQSNGDIGYSSIQRQMKLMLMADKVRMLDRLEAQFASRSALRPSFMTWGNVSEMHQQGIEFASHTVDHALLAVESEETIRVQLTRSKRELEDHLPGSAPYLAYPNGSYDDRVIKISSECGYVAGFTTETGSVKKSTPPFQLPRLAIDNHVTNGPSGEFCEARTRLHLFRGIASTRHVSKY